MYASVFASSLPSGVSPVVATALDSMDSETPVSAFATAVEAIPALPAHRISSGSARERAMSVVVNAPPLVPSSGTGAAFAFQFKPLASVASSGSGSVPAVSLAHAPSLAGLSAAAHKSAIERERERERERDRERAQDRLSSSRRGSDSDSDSVSTPYTSGAMPLKTKRKMRKNNREKQRRSELNDKFDELSELLRLGAGSSTNKVEKHSILTEAVIVIQALRKENYDGRQEKAELRTEIQRLTQMLAQYATAAATHSHSHSLSGDLSKGFPLAAGLSPFPQLGMAAMASVPHMFGGGAHGSMQFAPGVVSPAQAVAMGPGSVFNFSPTAAAAAAAHAHSMAGQHLSHRKHGSLFASNGGFFSGGAGIAAGTPTPATAAASLQGVATPAVVSAIPLSFKTHPTNVSMGNGTEFKFLNNGGLFLTPQQQQQQREQQQQQREQQQQQQQQREQQREQQQSGYVPSAPNHRNSVATSFASPTFSSNYFPSPGQPSLQPSSQQSSQQSQLQSSSSSSDSHLHVPSSSSSSSSHAFNGPIAASALHQANVVRRNSAGLNSSLLQLPQSRSNRSSFDHGLLNDPLHPHSSGSAASSAPHHSASQLEQIGEGDMGGESGAAGSLVQTAGVGGVLGSAPTDLGFFAKMDDSLEWN